MYRVGPIFVTRIAGVPADILTSLHTPNCVEKARAATGAAAEIEVASRELRAALKRAEITDREKVLQAIVKKQRLPDVAGVSSIDAAARYQTAVSELERLTAAADRALESDYEQIARKLLALGEQHLPGFAPFARTGMLSALDQLRSYVESREATSYDARRTARTVAHYLQRLAVKNETIAAYGPTAWGRVDDSRTGFTYDVRPGYARVTHFYEKWVVASLVRAINKDPATRVEAAPRPSRNVTIENATAIVLDTGARHALDERDQAVLARCDGKTLFDGDHDVLDSLAQRAIIVWQHELADLEPLALGVLVDDVARWRESPAKQRWSGVLDTLAKLLGEFADPAHDRGKLIERALAALHDLGIEPPDPTRSLYVGANVFGEECVRDVDVVLGGDLAQQLAEDAAPFYDLWQDMHAYISNEVARKLLEHVDLARPMPLPEYLAKCAAAGYDLRRDALPRLAGALFSQLKKEWTAYLAPRAPDAAHWKLGDEELGFVRRTHPATHVRDCSYPSIDVQLCAKGNSYELLLSELHVALAPLVFCCGWGCPDLPALVESSRRASGDVPVGYYGQMGPRLTAHTTQQFAKYFPNRFVYAANDRPAPDWRVVPPSQIEVHRVDDHGTDIRLRGPGGEDLGTVTRTWATQTGMHPFTFAWGPHSPRLYVGRVIVLRETWVVDGKELQKSTSSIAAVDALRAKKRWPRFIFTRPTGAALSRAGSAGLDKDTKPFFIDLESLLGVDALVHHIRKYGEIEVAEMLPTLDDPAWTEGDHNFSFELRMLIEPR